MQAEAVEAGGCGALEKRPGCRERQPGRLGAQESGQREPGRGQTATETVTSCTGTS